MYYPKSQIKPNQYTNGGEYVLINTTLEYVGFYYEVSNGERYSGNNPDTGGNIKLIPQTSIQTTETEPKPQLITIADFDSDPDPILIDEDEGDGPIFQTSQPDNNSLYSSLINPSLQGRELPQPHFPSPTPEEQQEEEYRRYFAKRTNGLIYIEISDETYDKFEVNDPSVASDLYEVLSLPWSLGGVADSTNINRSMVNLTEKDNKWYGFSSYFRGNFG